MKFYDLEKLRAIVKAATDLDISYVYDDLVFPDYTAFILQFHKESEDVFTCYFHEDCLQDEEERIFNKLNLECRKYKSKLLLGGSFNMVQKGEEVDVNFNS